uniref:Uncharacterized protein n=1 Tax=Arundo donax TaxID=35708 RepID=A0A0A8ZSS2_ARUDO
MFSSPSPAAAGAASVPFPPFPISPSSSRLLFHSLTDSLFSHTIFRAEQVSDVTIL